jgi:hypothetical protein
MKLDNPNRIMIFTGGTIVNFKERCFENHPYQQPQAFQHSFGDPAKINEDPDVSQSQMDGKRTHGAVEPGHPKNAQIL